MNDLETYFAQNTGRLIHKWPHYFEIYDRHFSRFRGTDVHVVEFGVSQGGSLQMWKHYFGSGAKVYGVDNNPNCKQVEEEQIEVIIGDQDDRGFLRSLTETLPRIDLLIDDGGHRMTQQIATFEELFPLVDAHGVYLCEDLHTSYRPAWGGGYGSPDSFVEYSKGLIDHLNAWHARADDLVVTDFTRSVDSMHYYDGVLVIEKRPTDKRRALSTGTAEISPYVPPESPAKHARERARREFGRPEKRST